jgi:uncharacterized membrane protein
MTDQGTLALLLACLFALIAVAAWEWANKLEAPQSKRMAEWKAKLKEFKDDDTSGPRT